MVPYIEVVIKGTLFSGLTEKEERMISTNFLLVISIYGRYFMHPLL